MSTVTPASVERISDPGLLPCRMYAASTIAIATVTKRRRRGQDTAILQEPVCFIDARFRLLHVELAKVLDRDGQQLHPSGFACSLKTFVFSTRWCFPQLERLGQSAPGRSEQNRLRDCHRRSTRRVSRPVYSLTCDFRAGSRVSRVTSIVRLVASRSVPTLRFDFTSRVETSSRELAPSPSRRLPAFPARIQATPSGAVTDHESESCRVSRRAESAGNWAAVARGNAARCRRPHQPGP